MFRRIWFARASPSDACILRFLVLNQVQILNSHVCFQKLNYIHNNPVVAGLTASHENYFTISEMNYNGLEAPLEIVFESKQLITY